MAHNQSLSIPAHPNIYTGSNERLLRIDYSIPDNGTNEETGILLLVPGFGGNIDSNVYKKMRQQFADQYSLVTVQCDYFGSKFMQQDYKIYCDVEDYFSHFTNEEIEKIKNNPDIFFDILLQYNIQVEAVAELEEDANEFADMSYMQAIDQITAIEAIKLILQENELSFNKHKIFGFGHSQGSYLLHLANRLSPGLFTVIFDNSAWVEPVFLHEPRVFEQLLGKAIININFNYIAQNFFEDKQALSLNELYKNFDNHAFIYSLLGTTDNLVNVEEKRQALNNMQHVIYQVIDEEQVDGKIFKSTDHGLDADFLELFNYLMAQVPIDFKNNYQFESEYVVTSSKTKIAVNYTEALPLFTLIEF